MMTSYWQVHCDQLTVADFPSDKYTCTLDCKYVSFCIDLITFKRLWIANSFIFIIFQCCYFYVMSQSTFHDQIRPRPLISCLNCAAFSLQKHRVCVPLRGIKPISRPKKIIARRDRAPGSLIPAPATDPKDGNVINNVIIPKMESTLILLPLQRWKWH